MHCMLSLSAGFICALASRCRLRKIGVPVCTDHLEPHFKTFHSLFRARAKSLGALQHASQAVDVAISEIHLRIQICFHDGSSSARWSNVSQCSRETRSQCVLSVVKNRRGMGDRVRGGTSQKELPAEELRLVPKMDKFCSSHRCTSDVRLWSGARRCSRTNASR